VSKEDCSRRYRTVTNITEGQLCAGGQIGEDSCAGDSGGPLAIPTSVSGVDDSGEKRFSLLGIVSFGARQCGSNTLPGVYTDVMTYRQWLEDSMKELGPINNRINETPDLIDDKMPPDVFESDEDFPPFEYDSTGNPIWGD
jgi:secreted trypsin-like serine protease